MRNKIKLWRNAPVLSVICLILTVIFGACEQSIGFGNTIDFEAPTLTVTKIILPDGTEKPIEKGNKLLIGQGIKVGPECILTGDASDNVLVTGIQVELIEKETGGTRVWNNAEIGPKGPDGKQTWRIVLDGIQKGEQNITISAFDKPKNVGPFMTQSLTLLVDTDPPFVENVRIERSSGAYIDLLPQISLEALDPNKLEYIDYFQNESFAIRASIVHDFELSDVTLNFLDEQGEAVLSAGLDRTGGGLTTPVWEITGKTLTDANPAYSTGRHYLQVHITAKALAGHSNDASNILGSLCWYPEADNARIQMDETSEEILEENGAISTEKESVLPITVFDDDSLSAVYAAMVPVKDWNAFQSGKTDDEKLQSLYDEKTREDFSSRLKDSLIDLPVKNATVPVTSASERGEYRLIVLVLDSEKHWTHRLFTVQVMEDGIPVISITEPSENISPELTADGNFTLKGSILNLDEVDFLRIAWVPAGPNWNANEQLERGQEALIKNAPADGIQIWNDIVLTRIDDQQIGNKWFKRQSFEKTFNIFDNFKYKGSAENAPKLFILYTRGINSAGNSEQIPDVFLTFRLMPYTRPPKIMINSPSPNGAVFGKNQNISFEIQIDPEKGIPIDTSSVKLISVNEDEDGEEITLTRGTGNKENIWTAAHSFSNEGDYFYQVTVQDTLGNENQLEQYVRITTLPQFKEIASPHANNTTFSERDTITIQAVFSGTVDTVTGNPRLVLEGFEDNIPRYAAYKDGEGSTTLNFVYDIQPGDKTKTGGLTVTAIDLNDGRISSEEIPASLGSLPKIFHVDGIAPVITDIEFIYNGDRSPWLRAGQELEIRVKTSKAIRVLGNPALKLSFNGRSANFQNLANSDTTMVFTYKVQTGDTANLVSCNAADCFSAADLAIITDKAGSQGNILSLSVTPALTGNVKIDTAPPAKLTVDEISEFSPLPPRRFQIITGGIESGAAVEYTIDGITWKTIPAPYTIPDIDDPGTYLVEARQTDLAGNISEASEEHAFTLAGESNFAALVCDSPDSAYPENSTLSFRLLFSGKVTASSGDTGPSITIGYDGSGEGVDITLKLKAPVTTGSFFLSFEWTVPSGLRWEPLVIKNISLNGVKRENGTDPGGDIIDVINTYNADRTGVEVLSIAPVITDIKTSGDVTVTPYNDAAAALDALSTTALDNENLILTFNHEVWPENGTITIKPSGDWLIPPVLTNEEYYNITKMLSSMDKTELDKVYIKTTHGLRLNGDNYVPDTATKYVLKFEYEPDNSTIRTIFSNAGYLQQEIDVQSSQVSGAGTSQIAIRLDTLPDGRIWDISISGGTFRDAAGNQSQVFSTVVWSGKTAAPVIRVNRVSNNHYSTNPAGQTADADTPGTKVQYRIDSVTPGAVIRYGVKESFDLVPYDATQYYEDSTNPNSAEKKSEIADASETDLTNISLSETYTIGVETTVGDNNLYTARKDYIAAQAERPNLGFSDRGYEGAFKTVVVYKGTPTGGIYVKIEGANVYGGQPTIAGFPLSNNDLSGKTNKYMYKDENRYIWISWEIVSDYYQVVLKTNQVNIDGRVDGASWQGTAWYHYNYRTYGSWGFQRNGF